MNFKLEQWRMAHAESIWQYANNNNIAKWLRDAMPHPYTRRDAEVFIAQCMAQDDADGNVLRAIVIDGEAAGSIGIFRQTDVYRKSAEIGYWLGEPFWGNGVMSRAVSLLCAEVFEKTDIVRIYAEPFAENSASCCVLEKAGFQREGTLRQSVYKQGKFMDSHVYALLRTI